MSRFKYNLGKEIAEYGNLLSDQGADTILDIIWYSCNINTFVTCAFTTANLNLGQFTEWIEIRRLFCNNGARRITVSISFLHLWANPTVVIGT